MALMVASPESVEGAFDAFVASFVERSVLTEANADGLTDKVASAATEEAREVVMCEALRALLKPGMVVTLTSAKSEAFKVRAGTVLYVPPDKRTDARKVHMLSSEADGSEMCIAALCTLRPAQGETTANPRWREVSLFWATEANDLEAMAALVEAAADANAFFFSNTPLLRALMHRHEDAVELLLGAGADPTLASPDGCTPLIMLAEPVPGEPSDASGARLVARLLRAGAAPTLERRDDDNGCTALATAALRGNVQVAAALLEGGAASDAADAAGVTPLMLCFAGEAEIAEDSAERPRHVTPALVRLLLSAGARVDAVDAEGRDALWYCRSVGRTDLLRLLQEHDNDANDAFDAACGADGVPLDATAAERLFTMMCVQREAENRRLGRVEDEEEVARHVAASPHFMAALDGRGELREDHVAFSDAYFGGAA